MNPPSTIKELHGCRYYTGAHPPIMAHYRAGNRPTEFGNKIWATSLVLIDHLQRHPARLQGRRVLEIGCGWGLIGVYLAKCHGCRVTCSDLDAQVLPIVQMHAALNDITIAARQAAFADLTASFLQNFDLIIGAEVCYSQEVARDINRLIERAFAAGVAEVLIADPGRPDFDDCCAFCAQHYAAERLQLPGSINGKTTHLLSVSGRRSDAA